MGVAEKKSETSRGRKAAAARARDVEDEFGPSKSTDGELHDNSMQSHCSLNLMAEEQADPSGHYRQAAVDSSMHLWRNMRGHRCLERLPLPQLRTREAPRNPRLAFEKAGRCGLGRILISTDLDFGE